MTPDASALLAWLFARGGKATVRDLGDTAPRRFRRAGVHGPLVDELLAAGRVVQICDRPRTFSVVAPAAAPVERQPEPQREPPQRAVRSRSVEVRRPDASEIRGAIRRAYLGRRASVSDAAALIEAASTFRAALIAEAREAAGLPCSCPTCGTVAAMVDAAIVEALR